MPEAISGNSPEGIIGIELNPGAHCLGVSIKSQRPLMASCIFEGKTVSKSLELIPLLFSVCGQAQSVAAIRAIENATKCPADTLVEQRREILVTLEGIREHLWRLLMDWPKLLGQRPESGIFATVLQSLNKLIEIANPEKRYTTAPGKHIPVSEPDQEFRLLWKDIKHTSLLFLLDDDRYSLNCNKLPANGAIAHLLDLVRKSGWTHMGDVAFSGLPDLPHKNLEELLLDNNNSGDFIAQPDWDGQCYETGPFARQQSTSMVREAIEQFGFGTYPRMVARIAELLQFIDRIDAWLAGVSLIHPKPASVQHGLSQVEAVRGRLVHSVAVDQDRILRYRILAPTEWNFHKNGIVSLMLSKLDSGNPEELMKQAEFLIKLIDPCVGYRLQLKRDNDGFYNHA